MPDRVLVTGAAGFIGGAVVAECHSRSIDVVGLDRNPQPPYPAPTRTDAAVDVALDLADADLEPVLDGVDAVIHLAGTPGVQSSWAAGFELHVRDNLLATQRLCEAALRVGVGRLVVASSSSIYGDVPSGRVAEHEPARPVSPYGASKAAMELLAGTYTERGLSVTPLRYFTVYGPWQRPDMAIHRMMDATLGGPAFRCRGDGSQARSFTYVDDVAAATVTAALTEQPPGEPINVGGTTVLSVRDLLAAIGTIAGRAVPIEMTDPAPGDPTRTSPDISRAREWLRWEPAVDMHEGLHRQWAWHTSTTPRRADRASCLVAASASPA